MGKLGFKTLVLVLILVVTIISPLFSWTNTVSATPTELITNGGFESGEIGWILDGDFYADSHTVTISLVVWSRQLLFLLQQRQLFLLFGIV